MLAKSKTASVDFVRVVMSIAILFSLLLVLICLNKYMQKIEKKNYKGVCTPLLSKILNKRQP